MRAFGVRAALAVSVGIACAICPAPASARTSRIDVPSQSALTAILEVARQSGIQILVRESVVRGKRTPAVRGAMEPQQALDLLLANTDRKSVV